MPLVPSQAARRVVLSARQAPARILAFETGAPFSLPSDIVPTALAARLLRRTRGRMIDDFNGPIDYPPMRLV